MRTSPVVVPERREHYEIHRRWQLPLIIRVPQGVARIACASVESVDCRSGSF